MTMTIPRAGTDPGRAPRAQAVQPAQGGALIGDLGEVMKGVGEQLQVDQLDRQFKRQQVDLTRDVNDLRLEIEAIGDPDAADQAWASGVSELRKKYTVAPAPGQNRIQRKYAENMDLAFDDLINRQSYSVGARNLGLRQSERQATYDAYVYEATRAATTADADTRAVMIDQGEEQIAGLLASGAIDAETAEKMRQDLNQGMVSAAALQVLNDDPAGYLERAEAGEFDALDPDAQVRMATSAKTALDKAAQQEVKLAEKAQADQLNAFGADLDRIASINDTTRLSPEDLALLDSKVLADLAQTDEDLSVKLQKAKARHSLDQEEALFSAMSPPELRQAIDEERARKVSHPFQEERIAVLEDLLASKERGLDADAIGQVAADGYAPPPLPLDQGQGAFEDGLRQRVSHGFWMKSKGYTEDLVVFTPDERKAIKTQLDASADPATRLDLINGMARQLGRDAETVILRVTGGDKVSAHATALLQGGARPDLVEDILTGQKMLADGTANTPNASAWREAFTDITEDMFAGQPELQARLQDTALVLYAQAAPIENATDIDSGAARTAINQALGGTGDTLGGIAEIDPPGGFNAYMLPLPPGLSARHLIATLDLLDQEMAMRLERDEDGGFTQNVSEADLSRLQAASLTGALPDFGDDAPRAVFDDLELRPWWPDGRPADRYMLVRNVGGREIALKDENGAAFMISLRRLVQGAEE